MTVVIGEYVSRQKEQTLIVTDEKASYAGRTSDIAEKISGFHDSRMLVAHTGMFSFRDRALRDYAGLGLAEPDPNAFYDVVAALKTQLIDSYLRGKLQIPLADFQSGFNSANGKPIDGALKERYLHVIDTNGGEIAMTINNAFLVFDARDHTMYVVDANSSMPLIVSEPYIALGSGSDLSDASLARYFENVPREERFEIGLVDAVRSTLIATAEAAHNVGVGGVPSIAFVDGSGEDAKVMRPDQRSSKLAFEIVQADRAGLLDTGSGFVPEALESIIRETAGFEKIDRNLWKAARDREKLQLFLRGYPLERPALS